MDEREFELINIIGPRIDANQRDLSRQMDISLGMINMLLRRLASKGYIRIKQLNKRKVEYILTPKGFAEKMRKSIKYTQKTINSIGLINNRLREVLKDLVTSGKRDFIIIGESDFAHLVRNVLNEFNQETLVIRQYQDVPADAGSAMLLICKEIPESEMQAQNGNAVNLVEELAKDFTSLVSD